jgi:WbqC-like protein family
MNTKDFVSDLFYWPSVDWYAHALHHGKVCVPHAVYSKKYHLNKTHLINAQGLYALSIPLIGGRNQRAPDTLIQISEAENWRQTHCRSIKTMYGRAPFFENIMPYIDAFYQQTFTSLYDCNLQSLQIINRILKVELELLPTAALPNYDHIQLPPIPYIQVFSHKLPFTPSASMLDLLMNEGKEAISILHRMTSQNIAP